MNVLTAREVEGAYPRSYFHSTAHLLEPFPVLLGNHHCDVCVIGAGYTGLSAALQLAALGYDVILIEARRVGWGASGRNAGHVGSGLFPNQDDIERMVGKARAHALWDLAQSAKAAVAASVATHNIACDFKPGIIYAEHRRRFVPPAHAYAERLRREYGYAQMRCLDQRDIQELVATDVYCGGILDLGASHLHPLNYALGLAQSAKAAGVRIFETSPALAVVHDHQATVRTAAGQIAAAWVVYACNGYIGDLNEEIAAHLLPINDFVIATEPLRHDVASTIVRGDVAVSDSKLRMSYFCLSPDNRLIFGGAESGRRRFPADPAARVRRRMLAVFPQLRSVRIDFAWGGTLAVTRNRLPHVARLAPNVLSAAGYCGYGVALATMCGRLLADAVAGRCEGFDLLASVSPPRWFGGPGLWRPLVAGADFWNGLRDRL